MEFERRFVSAVCEVRDAERPGTIGVLRRRAIVFNAMSEDLGGFRESIDPDSLNGALKAHPDVRSFWNHNTSDLLGRVSAGTLRLFLTRDGLDYEVDLPDTSAGRDVLVLARRGDLCESSFGFDTAPDGDEWTRRDDGTRHRRVTKIERLYEVSPVSIPAYPQTKCALRSMEAWEAKTRKRHHTTMYPRR